MNLKIKHCLRMNLGLICSIAVLSTAVPVFATDTENLENQSSALQEELSQVNSELLDMSTEIATIEIQVDNTNNAIVSTEEQLAIIRNNEATQYEDMKKRIKYMYENGSSSMLNLLFSAESIADFVNKADFIENVSNYDKQQIDALKDTINLIQEQQEKLGEQRDSLQSMQMDLENKQTALNQRAIETSTSIDTINTKIAEIKAEEQRKAEEAAAQAAAEAAAKAAAEAEIERNNASVPTQDTQSSDDVYTPPASYPQNSGGGLTPDKGVVYFNGHRETYYSQRVLPGTGLNIPGRHVASDGTIRDSEGYICVASSDYPKGTVVETSLGMGKVYDSGCASGTIDLYTDW